MTLQNVQIKSEELTIRSFVPATGQLVIFSEVTCYYFSKRQQSVPDTLYECLLESWHTFS